METTSCTTTMQIPGAAWIKPTPKKKRKARLEYRINCVVCRNDGKPMSKKMADKLTDALIEVVEKFKCGMGGGIGLGPTED